jgi:hypothetical protein
MEKEETLWIEKLRKLQILQRETFENLEFLMHSS